MYSAGKLRPSLQVQLAQIYRVSIERRMVICIPVKVSAVQQLTGKVDCGIFALA